MGHQFGNRSAHLSLGLSGVVLGRSLLLSTEQEQVDVVGDGNENSSRGGSLDRLAHCVAGVLTAIETAGKEGMRVISVVCLILRAQTQQLMFSF